MPLGEQECQPAAAEAAECQEGGPVEGGRDHWKHEREGERRGSRRKRDANAAGINHMGFEIQEQGQLYDPAQRSCEANTPYQQLEDGHNTSTKRQLFDGYDTVVVDLPSEDQHHAGVIGDVPIAHHSDITTLPGEEGEEEEEDIVCVMKRQLKEANDLLAKCGEALSEGIAYEAFFPVRIDEMLRATHSLEESLLQQKQTMKDRLQAILGLL